MALPEEVLFTAGAGELKDQDQFVLHSIAQAVKRVPYTILIEGHTDNQPLRPGSPVCVQLGIVPRARDVRHELHGEIRRPPSRERLGVAAFGEYHPRVLNDTPAHRAANRRIEISILRYE